MDYVILNDMDNYTIINSEKDISKYLNFFLTDYEKIFYFTMKFVKDFIKIKYTNNNFHKNWIDFLKDIDRSICSINNEVVDQNMFINILDNEHHLSKENINTILVLCSQSSLCLAFYIGQKNLLDGYYLSEISEKYCDKHNIDKSLCCNIIIDKNKLEVCIEKNLRIFKIDNVKKCDKTLAIVKIRFLCDLFNNSAYLKYIFINELKEN